MNGVIFRIEIGKFEEELRPSSYLRDRLRISNKLVYKLASGLEI